MCYDVRITEFTLLQLHVVQIVGCGNLSRLVFQVCSQSWMGVEAYFWKFWLILKNIPSDYLFHFVHRAVNQNANNFCNKVSHFTSISCDELSKIQKLNFRTLVHFRNRTSIWMTIWFCSFFFSWSEAKILRMHILQENFAFNFISWGYYSKMPKNSTFVDLGGMSIVFLSS